MIIYDMCVYYYICNHMHIWSRPPPSHRGIAAPSTPSEAQNLDYYIEVPRIYYIILHKCLCSSHITAVIKIQ